MTLSTTPQRPDPDVVSKKIHGWVRDTRNQKIGGVTIRAFRGTELYWKTTTAKDGANAGKYEFTLDNTGRCIDVMYFSHTGYHPSVLIPVCSTDNNFINPILYSTSEQIGGVVAMIQITNYDMILAEMARLRDPNLDIPSEKRVELLTLVPILYKKLSALSENIVEDHMSIVYQSRIAKMQEFCTSFSSLSASELIRKLS